MLISKPRLNTFLSLMTFLALDIVLLIYLLTTYGIDQATPVYLTLLIILLMAVAIIIIYKMIMAYKIVQVKQNTITVNQPLLFRKYKRQTQEIQGWKETIIITNKTEFKELKIVFTGKKVLKLTVQENSNYDRMLKFIKKHAAKLEIRD